MHKLISSEKKQMVFHKPKHVIQILFTFNNHPIRLVSATFEKVV